LTGSQSPRRALKGGRRRPSSKKPVFSSSQDGTAKSRPSESRLGYGREDYYVGGHPLWQILRGVFQMKQKPFVLAGTCLISAIFMRPPPGCSGLSLPEVVAFYRAEQMARLRKNAPLPSAGETACPLKSTEAVRP